MGSIMKYASVLKNGSVFYAFTWNKWTCSKLLCVKEPEVSEVQITDSTMSIFFVVESLIQFGLCMLTASEISFGTEIDDSFLNDE